MIFVTVGTHEQPFDRLIKCIDRLAEEKIVKDEFIVQTGFGIYLPKFCEYKHFFPYSDMMKFIDDARIVITHGGPSSFMPVIERNKIPIVVPRRKRFKEHINDHQIDFVERFSEIWHNIIIAENDSDIRNSVLYYDETVKNMPKQFVSNHSNFIRNIEMFATELMK